MNDRLAKEQQGSRAERQRWPITATGRDRGETSAVLKTDQMVEERLLKEDALLL